MAKGQKRSGREPKKPKQVKKAAPVVSPFSVSSSNKNAGARGSSK